jgi:hypothetical protein
VFRRRRLGASVSGDKAETPLFKEIGRRISPERASALQPRASERLSLVTSHHEITMPREDEDKRSLSPLILDDSLSSSSHLDSPRFSPVRFTSRRRRIVVTAVAVFSVFSLLGLAYLSSSRPLLVSQDPAPVPSLNRTPSLDRKSALLGPPTSRFRGSPQGYSSTFPDIVRFHSDNLRNDTKYITSWISAGWSECPSYRFVRSLTTDVYLANDVMTYVGSFFLHSPQDLLNLPRETSSTLPC